MNLRTNVLLVSILALTLTVSAQQQSTNSKGKTLQSTYTVSGHLPGVKASKVYLTYTLVDGTAVRDSADVHDGDMEFKGTVPYPLSCLIQSASDHSVFIPFVIENSAITIVKGDQPGEFRVTGSKNNDVLSLYRRSSGDFQRRYFEINARVHKAVSGGDTTIIRMAKAELNKFSHERFTFIADFIRQHADCYALFNTLETLTSIEGLTATDALKIFKEFDEDVKGSVPAQKFYHEIKTNGIGQLFADFTLADLAGKPIRLSDFRGKYVLIDFWASWCGACRMQNPNLLKAYERFHSKGFEIIAVSLDTKREDWAKAVREDHMPWKQVSDLKARKGAVVALHNIGGIPDNFLIDPAGVIVGRNFIGNDLYAKLEELYNQSVD